MASHIEEIVLKSADAKEVAVKIADLEEGHEIKKEVAVIAAARGLTLNGELVKKIK